jgi:hypothetical protein
MRLSLTKKKIQKNKILGLALALALGLGPDQSKIVIIC